MSQGELKLVESVAELRVGMRIVHRAPDGRPFDVCTASQHEGIITSIAQGNAFYTDGGEERTWAAIVAPRPDCCGADGFTALAVDLRLVYRRVDFDASSAEEVADAAALAGDRIAAALTRAGRGERVR